MRMTCFSLCLTLLAASAHAQAPPAFAPADPQAALHPVQMLNYVHAVKDLDKSLAFYRDAFQFPVASAPTAWQPAAQFAGPAGSQARSAVLSIPGADFALLLVQFRGVPRSDLTFKNSQPGASTLSVKLADLNATLAAASRAGAAMVTQGGNPRDAGPKMRLVFLKDPDGFFLELTTDPSAAPSAAGNVLGAHAGFSIADIAKNEQFYHGVLGLEYQRAGEYRSAAMIDELIGEQDTHFRVAFARLPGSATQWEFLEFKGSVKPAEHGLQDPGVTAISVAVADLGAALEALKAAAPEALAHAAKPVVLGTGERIAFLHDPSGTLIRLIQLASR